MVTTRQAAPAVRLNHDWQSKYRQRAKELLSSSPSPSPSPSSKAFCVCIVGRIGVGKGSLVNHLLQRRVAEVSHECTSFPDSERFFNINGFHIREIPGYDGLHAVAQKQRRRFSSLSSHRSNGHTSGSSHSSSCGHSDSDGSLSGIGGGRLELEDFVQTYRLFEDETNAIIFVVNNRITPDDQKLLALATDSRKFFCVVRTHADGLAQIAESTFQKQRMEETEDQLRKELLLEGCLDVRVFILSIPWPESELTDPELDGSDLKAVLNNTQRLHFPLLQAYLSEPKGLCDELQMHGYVKEEVGKVLEPLRNVKKRSKLLEFSEHAVVGTLVPFVGSALVSFFKMIYVVLKASNEVGLIQDADDAMEEVNTNVRNQSFALKIASKEALEAVVQDSMLQIFGETVFQIALGEVVSAAVDAAFGQVFLPVLGAAISAATLRHRLKTVADKLALKACMLHELWIMQNVTELLNGV